MSAALPSIEQVIAEQRERIATPYYLLDEARMLVNLEKIAELRTRTGTKSVLALKCFSTWAVFDLLRRYLDGTTSSSLYEARLGHEKFGGEVHAYSVAFADEEFAAVAGVATKIIFNSVTQLRRFRGQCGRTPVGLRLNPGVSHSGYDLADPARRHSRLGVSKRDEIESVMGELDGLMFHCNCENADFGKFSAILDHIAREFAPYLRRVKWVSLGGGISFTQAGYPFDAFADRLTAFARQFDVQLYLEPGEAAVAGSGFLVTKVLDIVRNDADIAIVDAGAEPHMLDLLVYRMQARLVQQQPGGRPFIVAGRTCLAGDVFGHYLLPADFGVGSLLAFEDAAGYTMVKKNWFNGLAMPAIVVRRLDGRVEVVRRFDYDEFVGALS